MLAMVMSSVGSWWLAVGSQLLTTNHQPDFAAVDDDPNHSALGKRPEQRCHRQRLLDDALDEAGHGSRAKRAIEALRREPGASLRCQLERHTLGRHHRLQLVDLLVHDFF